MNYAYYPGCSLEGSAQEYDLSSRLVLDFFGIGLREIDGWTCCGASAVEPVSELLAQALPARNLALAARMEHLDQVLVPCAACYLNLLRVNRKTMREASSRARVNEALSAEGLSYDGNMQVRHLLDVLANEIGPDQLRESVRTPLEGLTLAPYYGCQILRPYVEFDDPERPKSMEPLLEAAGAAVHRWGMGARCCGASLMVTAPEAALADVRALLEAAQGADAIVTVCPMCQMNLEAYQDRALSGSSAEPVSVLYLPQVLALALGFDPKSSGMNKNLAVERRIKAWMREHAGLAEAK